MILNHKNKNIILLVIVLFIGGICHAATDDFHLCMAIKYINSHSFNYVEQELDLVQDWYYKETTSCEKLNIDNALEYVGYAFSHKVNEENILKMGCYIISECGHLGKNAFQRKEYEDALIYFDISLALMQPIVGENNKEYALISLLIGHIYEEKADYDNAETYYLKGATILKQLSLEENHDYAKALEHLGIIHYKKKNYSVAEKYLLQSAEIIKTIFDDTHLEYGEIMAHLSIVYYKIDNFARSKQFFLNFFRVFKTFVEKNSIELAIDMDVIESIFDAAIGYSKLDETLIASIIPIIQNGDEYELNLGQLYQGIGDLSKAEYYYLHALQKNVDKYGEDNENQAVILKGIASIYSALGDKERALINYEKALHICKKYYGDEDIDVANNMDNIGNVLMDKGEYESARYYLEEALRVKTIILGELHSEVASTLKSLGNLYRIIGEEEKSEQSFLAAINIIKSTKGENSRDHILLLNDIAILYKVQLEYAKAERYYKEALKRGKVVLGEENHSYKTTQINLCRLYYSIGMYDKAYVLFIPYSKKMKELFINSINFLSEEQREIYLETMNDVFEYIAPRLSYQHKSITTSLSNSLAYNNELFKKGLLLASSKSISTSILESNDTTLIKKWHTLTVLKQSIIRSQDSEDQTTNTTILKEKTERLEKDILRSSAEYRANVRFWNITWDSVRAELKPNQVAIEYMSAPLNEDSIMYCALLLRDTCSYPIMIPLFEEKQVTQKYNTFSGSFSINITYAYQQDGKELSALIWNKVQPYLNMDDEVYFSPTGIIHQIAIENLPYDATRTMADVYHLVRLSSTRELAMHKKPIQQTSAALYGDIAYQEMDANTMLALSTKYNDGTRTANPSRLVDLSQEFEPTAPLPGTKAEIDSIAPILKKQHIAVKVYAQQEACEESVKALSGQKRNILHISTHGFFRPDNGKNSDPMDRCGLYFAGVDKVLKDGNSALPGNVDDGILTAKEISLLDLRDADLVVLSACETGLGDISGEGVFGLQRAFKMAGARTILMTLWRVHDDATRMLMTAFYRHYGQTHDKRTAFRAAQQEVRATYKDPYYWAGFIMLD